jgi:glycosyltransferase involved in cell wall biosynthesis
VGSACPPYVLKISNNIAMKILITHNSYQQQGGEDTAVNAEIKLLRDHRHDIMVYRRHNSEIHNMTRTSTALSTIWSQQVVNDVGRLCEQFQPDLIHSHNSFPLISPSIYWAASRHRIPVVQTLHNFRLLCPQAMFLRDGHVCEDCLGKIPWRAVTRKCYHDSTLRSAVTASMLTAHQAIGTFREKVSAYIALNHFCRDKFIAGGLPAKKIHIKPNFVESIRTPDWRARKDALFVGRLSSEKGLDSLIDATRRLQASTNDSRYRSYLKVIGTGPLEAPVTAAFQNNYLGYLPRSSVYSMMQSSLFMIAPSTCYETFGLAAVEAFSCGLPVIASRHGGLAELVKDGVTGLLFRPGDANDLAEKIAWALANPDEMLKMGRAAYEEYLHKYTPEHNYRILIDIYEKEALTGMQHAYRYGEQDA